LIEVAGASPYVAIKNRGKALTGLDRKIPNCSGSTTKPEPAMRKRKSKKV
jgi:hypothetical protein